MIKPKPTNKKNIGKNKLAPPLRINANAANVNPAATGPNIENE